MSHFKLKRKGEGDGGPKPDLTSLLAIGNQITSECAALTNLPPITFFPNKLVTHMINTQIVQKDLQINAKPFLSHTSLPLVPLTIGTHAQPFLYFILSMVTSIIFTCRHCQLTILKYLADTPLQFQTHSVPFLVFLLVAYVIYIIHLYLLGIIPSQRIDAFCSHSIMFPF